MSMIPPLAPIVPTKRRNYHTRLPTEAEREALKRMMQGRGYKDRSVITSKGCYPSSGAEGHVGVDVLIKRRSR